MITKSIYKELSEIIPGLTKKYLNKKNPIHKFLIRNKNKNALIIFKKISKYYINNSFNILNPLPFSAVRISDEMPLLDWIENNSKNVLKSYVVYRQGRISDALKILNHINTDEASLLKALYCNQLNKKKKSLIIIKKIKKKKKYKNEINFLSNSLNIKKEKIEFYKTKDYEKTKIIFLKNFKFTKKFNEFKKYLIYDLNFTRTLAKKLKNADKYLKIIHKISKNRIPLTSEIVSGYILCLYLEKNFKKLEKLYSNNLIVFEKKFFKDLNEVFNKKIKTKIINDFNTSKLNGRFYTPDLSKGYGVNQKFQKNISKVSSKLEKFFKKNVPIFKNLKMKEKNLWFDYSFNYNKSKINNHLHTAGYKRFNVFTFVIYKKVPNNLSKNDKGNLRIYDKEIPIFDRNLNVSTGDLVAFPSYYFHQTIPSNTKVLRETINVDCVIKLENISFKD